MILVYCGDAVEDDSAVPLEAFEALEKRSFEDDLFQAKVFLHVIPGERIFAEDDDLESSHQSSQHDEEPDELDPDEEEQAAYGAQLKVDAELAESRRKEVAAAKLLSKELDALKANQKALDLRVELDRVECIQHYQCLADAGYAEEGSFLHLTDELLKGRGLWIPKKGRNRILALGVQLRIRVEKQIALQEMNKHKAFRSALDSRSEKSSPSKPNTPATLVKGDPPKMLLDGSPHGGLQIQLQKVHDKDSRSRPGSAQDSGRDSYAEPRSRSRRSSSIHGGSQPHGRESKLAHANSAMTLFTDFTIEEDAEYEADKAPAVAAAVVHPTELQRKIDLIRSNTEVDRAGFLKNYRVPLIRCPTCCSKHKQGLTAHHLKYEQVHNRRIETDLKLIVAKADADLFKNGFIPREVLRRIAVEQLDFKKKHFNRYSQANRDSQGVSVAAAVPVPTEKISAIKVKATSSEASSAISVTALPRPPTPGGGAKKSDDDILKEAEVAEIELLLDSCMMAPPQLFKALSWAGEFERRRLNYGDPLVADRVEGEPIVCSPEVVGLKSDPERGAQTSLPHIFLSPITPMFFYSSETFCTLLLRMIHAKTDRNCQLDGSSAPSL